MASEIDWLPKERVFMEKYKTLFLCPKHYAFIAIRCISCWSCLMTVNVLELVCVVCAYEDIVHITKKYYSIDGH